MTAPRRLALYAVALLASFGGGAALGAAVGPIDVVEDAPMDTPMDTDESILHDEGSH